MKFLCNYTPCGPAFVRNGWANVLRAMGHEFTFWEPSRTPAFDAFSQVEPDVYLGTTYELDRATAKCIVARPQMKVALYASAWGPYLKDVDLTRYPLVVTGEQEKATIERLKKETGKPDFVFIHAHGRWLDGTMSGWGEIGVPYKGVLNAADLYSYFGGMYRPELACDIGFVGSRWGYKSRNIDKYFLPLCHPSSGLSVKIFGNQGGWPVPQYLGTCSDKDSRDLFASATVCPNVSEPHSTDYGHDCVERMFKVPAAGGFCVSDYVDEAKDIFDDDLLMFKSSAEYQECIRHYARFPEERMPFILAGQRRVLSGHTYHHRVSQIMSALGFESEAKKALDLCNIIVATATRII